MITNEHHKKTLKLQGIKMVPEAGLEPAQPKRPRDFKSLASTNSATPATIDVLNSNSFFTVSSIAAKYKL